MAEILDKTLVCIGGANMDIQGFSNAPINMRDSNPGSIRLCPGGVGRNIAENLARMGARVHMVSAVGDDFFGDMLLKYCAEAGILTSDMEIIPGANSSVYLVLTDHDGDMLAAISDMHIMKRLGADFILRHSSVLNNADAIVLDPNLSPESLETLTSEWSYKPIFADPISTAYAGLLKSFLSKLYMVKCNRQEAEIFADMEIRNKKELETAADRMLSLGVGCAVITLGAEGVYYKDRNGSALWKRHTPLEPVSATGAGDSFTAAMVFSWLNGLKPDAALEFAMLAAETTLMDSLTVSPKIETLTKTFFHG